MTFRPDAPRRRLLSLILCTALCAGLARTSRAEEAAVPAPGASSRIDAIKQRGTLRVGALGEFPWLAENASGSGDPFAGPAWQLAGEYAKRLGVKLEVVAVSHETKVPILASGQVDMTIAPLAVTPKREQVVDFVVYSTSALCLFGQALNPKLVGKSTVDALDSPDVTVAYFTGTPPETWLPQRLTKAQRRGVPGSGANAPVDEILSHRADVAPIDNVAWADLQKKVPGLVSFPGGDACLQSHEMATPIGLAVDKGQTAYLTWLRAVEKAVEPQLRQTELDILKG